LLNVAPASREATDDFGVVPLGMPLIAGPALLTALLVLVDTVGLVFTVAALLVNLALVVVAFWNADFVARWMGRQGLRGMSKIVALLLAAIAVSLIRRGGRPRNPSALRIADSHHFEMTRVKKPFLDRWQYAGVLRARILSIRRSYHHVDNASSTQLRLPCSRLAPAGLARDRYKQNPLASLG